MRFVRQESGGSWNDLVVEFSVSTFWSKKTQLIVRAWQNLSKSSRYLRCDAENRLTLRSKYAMTAMTSRRSKKSLIVVHNDGIRKSTIRRFWDLLVFIAVIAYIDLSVRRFSASQRKYRLGLKRFCQASTKSWVFSIQNVDTLKSTTKSFQDPPLSWRTNRVKLKALYNFEVHVSSTLSWFEPGPGLTFCASASSCAWQQ